MQLKEGRPPTLETKEGAFLMALEEKIIYARRRQDHACS